VDEVKEYLEAVLGEAPSPSVATQLAEVTSGNPLFITEHLEQMIAEGRLFSLAGRPDQKTLKAMMFDFSQTRPSRSLESSLARSLEKLPADASSLALLIACWQRPVGIDELSEAFTGKDLGGAIMHLKAAGIVKQSGLHRRLSFINPLAAKIISSRSNDEERCLLHDKIRSLISERRKKVPAEIALHTAYGSDRDAAIDSLLKLSKDAQDALKPMDAISHLEEMLRRLPKDDWKRRSEVVLKIGSVYEDNLMQEDARRYYKKLLSLKAPKGDELPLALMALEHLGRLEMRIRDLGTAKKYFTEGLKRSSGKSRPLVVARLKFENFIAGVEMREGLVRRAVERFEKTRQIAERILSKEERHLVLNNELAESLLMDGDAKGALKVLKSDLKIAESIKDDERIAVKHYLMGNAFRHDSVKRPGDAMSHYDTSLSIAKAKRLLKLQVRVLNGIGNLSLTQKKFKEAFANYREAFRLAQQVDSLTTCVEIMIGMGLSMSGMGKTDGLIEYFEAALDFAGGPKGASAGLIKRYMPTIFVLLGDAYYKKKDLATSLCHLERAREFDEKIPLSPDLRYSLYATLSEIAIEYKDFDSVADLMPVLGAIVKLFPSGKEHYEEIRAILQKERPTSRA
jgi:tetratricopeptide (TPR) repeat protein